MIIPFLVAAMGAAMPLLFATLGAINNEKVGNLNLGIEGIMIMGAFGGVYMAHTSNNGFLAILYAMFIGALVSLIYAVLTISFRTSQAVTGLTLTIFGTSLANTLGKSYVGLPLSENVLKLSKPIAIPLLSKIPVLGPVVFNQNIMVYMGLIIVGIMYFYYNHTSYGLNLKAVGENPSCADAAGINVEKYKYFNVLLGGALCGLAGAYLSIVIVNGWQQSMTAGRGWIAVALVVFCSWRPRMTIVGAFLFGGLRIISFYFKLPISLYLIAMTPYLFTIIILIIMSNSKASKTSVPKALGLTYFREAR